MPARLLAAARRPWAYREGPGRDLRLDLLRGYALLAMIVNHTVVGNSWFYAISGIERFYTSAAESFYLISGLVLGTLSARLALGDGVRRILRRTRTLYLVAVAMSLGFAALAFLFGDLRLWYDVQDELPRAAGERLAWAAGVLTLHEAFHGAQILVLYVLYMLVATLALALMAAGRTWRFLGGLGLLYAISQFAPEAVALPFATYPLAAAWAPLFFGGLALGYHREAVAGWWRRLPGRPLLTGLLLAAAAWFMWLYVTGFRAWPELPELLGAREAEMRPQRLALVALFALVAYMLATWLWAPLRAAVGWLLLPLGQASLWAFVAHLVVIVLIYNTPFHQDVMGREAGTLVHAAALLLVWASVMLRGALRGRLPAPQARGSGTLV